MGPYNDTQKRAYIMMYNQTLRVNIFDGIDPLHAKRKNEPITRDFRPDSADYILSTSRKTLKI